jgi:hypothetical protein
MDRVSALRKRPRRLKTDCGAILKEALQAKHAWPLLLPQRSGCHRTYAGRGNLKALSATYLTKTVEYRKDKSEKTTPPQGGAGELMQQPFPRA